MFKSLINSKV